MSFASFFSTIFIGGPGHDINEIKYHILRIILFLIVDILISMIVRESGDWLFKPFKVGRYRSKKQKHEQQAAAAAGSTSEDDVKAQAASQTSQEKDGPAKSE